ncbi:hypothetical protein [Streptomyces sp. NPDC048252]|uniref:hypothetical protein n=1 Tax=Streptomyces sp. NPDC048252 TaxID=3154612 RepID=UPI003417B0DF
MSHLALPHPAQYTPSMPRQPNQESVSPRDHKVRVHRHWPDSLLDGTGPAPFFLVETWRPHDNAGDLASCTPETCRRWVAAALAYASAVDEVSAELAAAHQGVGSVPRWRYFAARRALHDWEQVRERYEQTVREAGEAYQPISREIWHAVWAEHDRADLRAREEARKKQEQAREEAQARQRATELAERPIWGWSVVTRKNWSTAYIFRHDVPHSDERVSAARQDRPCVNLPELRQALKDLHPDRLHWDDAALAETGRESDGVGFERCWRELFGEDHATFTSLPPPPPRTRRPTDRGNPSGGSATSGTGGFGGGLSSGGFGGFGGGY